MFSDSIKIKIVNLESAVSNRLFDRRKKYNKTNIVIVHKIYILTYGLHVQNILNNFQYCKPDSISLCNLALVFFSYSRGVLEAATDSSTFFHFGQQFLFLLFDGVRYLSQSGLAIINGSRHVF